MVIKTLSRPVLISLIAVVISLTKSVECCSAVSISRGGDSKWQEEMVSNTSFSDFVNHSNRNALAQHCPLAHLTPKIVGGEEAAVGEYPWLALLGYDDKNAIFSGWRCGGALIGEQYILTAAHCVTGLTKGLSLSQIRLGEHQRDNYGRDCGRDKTGQRICNKGVQDFDIETIIIHPNYDHPTPFLNDIAIVKIAYRVQLNDFVKPICLPYHDDPTEEYLTMMSDRSKQLEAWVAGWGATDPNGRIPADKLQHISLNIFSGDCRKRYGGVYVKGIRFSVNGFSQGAFISKQSQLCAGGEEGRDSCIGDSGSVLITHDTLPEDPLDSWKIIGIVSFGQGQDKCGIKNVPGVYAKVRFYIDWILDNVSS